MTAGHGVNIGHGYVKYSVIDDHGVEGKRHLFEIKPEPTRRRESA